MKWLYGKQYYKIPFKWLQLHSITKHLNMILMNAKYSNPLRKVFDAKMWWKTSRCLLQLFKNCKYKQNLLLKNMLLEYQGLQVKFMNIYIIVWNNNVGRDTLRTPFREGKTKFSRAPLQNEARASRKKSLYVLISVQVTLLFIEK